MIASEDDALYEAAKTLFYKSSEEEIRMCCLDREDYYADLRSYQKAIEEKQKELDLDRLEYEQESARIREYYETQIRQLRSEIEQLKKQ